MEPISETLREPVVTFALLLAVILIVPPVFERLRLPGLVGLLAAGVLLGGSGLNALNVESDTMKLLSEIGKIYLMFVAGLEIDLAQFRQTRNRSLGFGFATFAIPLIGGTALGRVFGFDWNASILIGSLLASHTLLAYPIVRRLGVVRDEAVTVTIGATIFTDVGALLVLAICVGVSQGDFSTAKLVTLLGGLALYSVAVLFGLDWLGKDFFRRTRDDQGNQFLFVLLAVFVTSVGAQLIGVEKIIGAFLAGLAVNDVVGDGPVKEKVEFVGSVLFIPIFFVDMGLLLDVQAFQDILASIGLPVAIVVMLLLTKFLAAWVAKLLYRYNWIQTLTMWSLSVPQVAATLAAALVGYQAEIINRDVFNSVILLMLVTAVGGPLITSRVAAKLSQEITTLDVEETGVPAEVGGEIASPKDFKVVVPVYNPETERYLIELGALLARHEKGKIIPLAIARAQAHMDSPQLSRALQRGEQLLDQAVLVTQEQGVDVMPQMRIAYDVAQGISHLSREVDASLVILGLSREMGFRARLFGNIADSVLWSSHCMVAVARLLNSPLKFQRILVPVENFTPSAVRTVRFAQILAAANDAEVTLLHVCSPRMTEARQAWFRSQMTILAERLHLPPEKTTVQLVREDNIVTAILRVSQDHELVVLRSLRRRGGADGLAVSEVTTPLIQRLACSVVLLGESQTLPSAVTW